MSYILDALKKADAERSNHANAEFQGSALAPASQKGARSRTRWWGALALVLLAVGAAVFYAWPSQPGVELQAAGAASPEALGETKAPTPGAADQPPPPPRPPMAQQATQQPASGEDTKVAQASPPAGPAEPPAAPSSSGNGNRPEPPKPGSPGMPDISPSLPPGVSVQQILKRAPLPSAQPKVAPANQRPEPVQNPAPKPTPTSVAPTTATARPAIAISGSSYSASPEQRMLIVNGKLVKEGQELQPGITLETIGEHTAVFNQGGSRFNVNY